MFTSTVDVLSLAWPLMCGRNKETINSRGYKCLVNPLQIVRFKNLTLLIILTILDLMVTSWEDHQQSGKNKAHGLKLYSMHALDRSSHE